MKIYDNSRRGGADITATYPLTLGAGESGGITLNADANETVGSNLVTDGDMSVPGSWTATGGWSVAGGVASFDGLSTGFFLQPGVYVALKTHGIIFTVSNTTGARISLLDANNAVMFDWETFTNGTYIRHFTALSNTQCRFVAHSDGDSFDLDNVMARQVTSPKQNGITVEIDRVSDQCITSKTVAGTTTVLDASSVTYGAAKELIALHDSDNELAVIYDGSRVYQGAVSDASVIYNKRHYVEGDGSGTLVKERIRYGAEEATGTCTLNQLYQITATAEDNFFVGDAVGDYFVSDGTETLGANDKVKKVNP